MVAAERVGEGVPKTCEGGCDGMFAESKMPAPPVDACMCANLPRISCGRMWSNAQAAEP